MSFDCGVVPRFAGEEKCCEFYRNAPLLSEYKFKKMSTSPKQRPRHLVLWDGECGFCRRSVEWLAAHDKRGALDFKPYQSVELAPSLKQACSHAMHVIKADGEIIKAGRAMMFCGLFTPLRGWARIGAWPIFLPFVELGYKFVAHNRTLVSKLFFKSERPDQLDRVTE